MQYTNKHGLTCYYMVDMSTTNITPDYSKKLGIIAKANKRSKTGQLEVLIDAAYDAGGFDD